MKILEFELILKLRIFESFELSTMELVKLDADYNQPIISCGPFQLIVVLAKMVVFTKNGCFLKVCLNWIPILHRVSYMSAHVLLNLLNKLWKSLFEHFITFSQLV